MKPKKIVPYPLFDSDSPSLLSEQADTLNILLNKPFWNWSTEKHDLDFLIDRNCCFNHIIGLPVKNDKEYPLFDYEKLIFDAIENNQNIWILKSRGHRCYYLHDKILCMENTFIIRVRSQVYFYCFRD
jgi:hypothetical protein